MATLLESLNALVTTATREIAEKLGESEDAVGRGVPLAFTAILGALVTRTSDPSSFRQVFDLITSRPAGTDVPVDMQGALNSLDTGGTTSDSDTKFLNILFAGRTNEVGDFISRIAGFKHASSGTSLLYLTAPLVLGVLRNKVSESTLDSIGLLNVVSAERNDILSAAAPELTSLLGTTPSSDLELPEWSRITAAERRYLRDAARVRETRRWIWPAVAAVALLFIWFSAARRNTRGPSSLSSGQATVDSTLTRPESLGGTAGGEVVGAPSAVGISTKRTLPGGAVLNIPENGTESKLIGFIVDSSRSVNDSTWFEFDRVNFASGSAEILPESQEQLQNIATILKAYPNVTVKVGGYTDNVGNRSANLRLSQQRASAVRQMLISDGVAANRVAAEGYGGQYPVADNATEEGRAKNRRIALRVTAK